MNHTRRACESRGTFQERSLGVRKTSTDHDVGELSKSFTRAHRVVGEKSHLSRKEKERMGLKHFFFFPHSRFRLFWDLNSCLLTLFVSLTLPFRLAFIDTEWSLAWYVIDFCIDIFFLADIVVNMRTMVITHNGALVTSPRKIFMMYARSWLIIDLVASIPVEWFRYGVSFAAPGDTGGGGGQQSQAQLLRLLRLTKLLRLLRVARLFRYFSKWEDHHHFASTHVLRLCNLIVVLVLFSHWNGCLQYFLTSCDTAVNEVTGALAPHPDTWIRRTGVHELPPLERWSWAFYQVMMQLLALSQGLVEPRRPLERWLFMVSIIFGAGLYAMFVASLTSVFSEFGASGREYRSKIDMLHQYMRNLHMPRQLCTRLQAYYELKFPQRTMFDEAGILEQLSPPLKLEVAMLKCHDVLDALEVLHERGLARHLALHLERVVFVDGDQIIHEGDVGKGLYFISSGSVAIFLRTAARATKISRCDETVEPTREPLRRLGKGSFFGEMALLEPGGTAMGDVCVTGYCEGWYLSREYFESILQGFPQFRMYIERVAQKRLLKLNRTANMRSGCRASESAQPRGRLGSVIRSRLGSVLPEFVLRAVERVEVRTTHRARLTSSWNDDLSGQYLDTTRRMSEMESVGLSAAKRKLIRVAHASDSESAKAIAAATAVDDIGTESVDESAVSVDHTRETRGSRRSGVMLPGVKWRPGRGRRRGSDEPCSC
jgi:CRP-like cAMP-binding protein